MFNRLFTIIHLYKTCNWKPQNVPQYPQVCDRFQLNEILPTYLSGTPAIFRVIACSNIAALRFTISETKHICCVSGSEDCREDELDEDMVGGVLVQTTGRIEPMEASITEGYGHPGTTMEQPPVVDIL